MTTNRIFLAAAICMALFLGFIGCTVAGRAAWNEWFHAVQKTDDATRYTTRRQVEDQARSMIASHQSDVLAWRQYRSSESADMRSVAEQAKMRANSTAAVYNEFMLKNSYVWSRNIPNDIDSRLDYQEAD